MITPRAASLVIVIPLLCALSLVHADDDAPATHPTTTLPYVAVKVIVPPGFHVITVGDRSALCQTSDDAWVKEALASAPPATRPTTMPSDIIQSIRQQHDQLTSQMMRDLALSDPQPLDNFLDNKLIPGLARIQALNPAVYYLIATRQKVADLMADGWTDSRFHYIRFAHDVAYRPLAIITTDRPMDELLFWPEFHDGDTTATKRDNLVAEIVDFEEGYPAQLSTFGKNQMENETVDFIHKQVMVPLKLPRLLNWFDFGVCNIYAVKYASEVTGISRQEWTERVIGRPGEPTPWMSLDLVNPIDPATIRPDYLMNYNRALVLKAATVIQHWIDKGGDGVLAKTLPTLRAHAPATSPDLIKVILTATGIDLTNDMLPSYGSSPASQPAR